jgi:hypothetical protein
MHVMEKAQNFCELKLYSEGVSVQISAEKPTFHTEVSRGFPHTLLTNHCQFAAHHLFYHRHSVAKETTEGRMFAQTFRNVHSLS